LAITFTTPTTAAPGLPGGVQAAINITAAAVIKAESGVIVTISPILAGSTGSLILNDCLTTGAAAAGNQICAIPFGSMSTLLPIILNWPCSTGIVVSAVTTGGQFSISFS